MSAAPEFFEENGSLTCTLTVDGEQIKVTADRDFELNLEELFYHDPVLGAAEHHLKVKTVNVTGNPFPVTLNVALYRMQSNHDFGEFGFQMNALELQLYGPSPRALSEKVVSAISDAIGKRVHDVALALVSHRKIEKHGSGPAAEYSVRYSITLM